jgi:hypothetical protein
MLCFFVQQIFYALFFMHLFGGMLKLMHCTTRHIYMLSSSRPQEYSATSLTVPRCGIEEMTYAGV